MPNGTVYLEVDASELHEEINILKHAMKPEAFDRAMYGIFKQTGKHVKKILQTDLPQKYNIKSPEVGKAVQGAKVTMGSGSGAGCTIPVVASRRHIGGGGRGFTAYGYRRGWASLTSGHYDITAVIYRGKRSRLPAHMKSYGGKPPFRNVPSKLNGLTFTRAGDARLPIMVVKGIGIPQMPMNRSKPEVQNDIKDYMFNRMEHRLQALVRNGY